MGDLDEARVLSGPVVNKARGSYMKVREGYINGLLRAVLVLTYRVVASSPQLWLWRHCGFQPSLQEYPDDSGGRHLGLSR